MMSRSEKMPPALDKIPKSFLLRGYEKILDEMKELLLDGISLYHKDTEDGVNTQAYIEWRKKVCLALGIDHKEFFDED